MYLLGQLSAVQYTGVASEIAVFWICSALLYLGMLCDGTANFEPSEFEVPCQILR